MSLKYFQCKKIFGPYLMLLTRVREGRRKLVWRLRMAARVWWREEPSSWPGMMHSTCIKAK